MKKRFLCIALLAVMIFSMTACKFKEEMPEKKYDYNLSDYITLPEFESHTIDIELDSLQAAIDSYLVNASVEYTVSRGDDIYIDIVVYEEKILTSNTGEVIKKKGDKIDALSLPNYYVENLGSSELPYIIETDIINSESKLKDIITRKYSYDQLDGFVPEEYEGQNLYFEMKIMNKKTQLGDVVLVAYKAYLVDENNAIILDEDGKETPFDKSDSSKFFLGSKLAIDDFENNLVDILLYDKHSFYATFPDDYAEEEYRNKKALFEVTVNYIYTAPIYNNDFIKSYFTDYTTTADFESELKKEYLKEKMMDYVFDNATVIKYPDAEYNAIKADIEASADSFKEYYGYSFDEYIKAQGFTSRDEYIKGNMKTEMIYYAIAEKLNIKPTDAMLENERTSLVNMYKTLYMEQQGLDEATALSTAEEFVKNLGDVYIYENVLFDLVKVELFRNAIANELPRTYESISEVLAKEAAGEAK